MAKFPCQKVEEGSAVVWQGSRKRHVLENTSTNQQTSPFSSTARHVLSQSLRECSFWRRKVPRREKVRLTGLLQPRPSPQRVKFFILFETIRHQAFPEPGPDSPSQHSEVRNVGNSGEGPHSFWWAPLFRPCLYLFIFVFYQFAVTCWISTWCVGERDHSCRLFSSANKCMRWETDVTKKTNGTHRSSIYMASASQTNNARTFTTTWPSRVKTLNIHLFIIIINILIRILIIRTHIHDALVRLDSRRQPVLCLCLSLPILNDVYRLLPPSSMERGFFFFLKGAKRSIELGVLHSWLWCVQVPPK